MSDLIRLLFTFSWRFYWLGFRFQQGTLLGCDQYTNVVLEKCHERIYTEEGVSQQPIGVYIIKGDNMYVCNPRLHDFALTQGPGKRNEFRFFKLCLELTPLWIPRLLLVLYRT